MGNQEVTTGTLNKFVKRQAKRDAVIDYLKRIGKWDSLTEAINGKMDEQHTFVEWWEKTVTPNKSSGNNQYRSITVRKSTIDVDRWAVRVHRWREYLEDRDAYRARIGGAAYRAAWLEVPDNHLSLGTGEIEWYTPSVYIEAARKVMGEIDCDPASSLIAQKTVKAKEYFNAKINGLTKEWYGRIWLNPPYSKELIWQFIDKLVEELTAGRATEAILLTHNYTDTSWWQLAQSIAQRMCFHRGRVKFIDTAGKECAPTQGQLFLYYGENGLRFEEVFTVFGPVWGR